MVTVFEWDMFRHTQGGFSVGHASMLVNAHQGSIYISFWPAAHSLSAGWASAAKVHFINGDIKADGQPSWASKPISTLNENAIINWWSKVQSNPLLNYKNPTPIQKKGMDNAKPGNVYAVLFNSCSTAILKALWTGADPPTQNKILVWSALNKGGVPWGPFRLPTITPLDVKNLVEYIF